MPIEQLPYVTYLERWQLTPDQVDNLPLWLEPWLLPIAGVLDEVHAEQARQEAKKTQRT